MSRVLARWRFLFACVVACWLAALAPSALAATCSPAGAQGASGPADFRTYCWLDFSTYSDSTARNNNGQAFTFNLPDGSKLTFTLKTTSGNLVARAVPSWTGSAFGNSGFLNIPGLPILYTPNAGTTSVTLTNIAVTPPAGGTGTSQFSIIVGDGESTNSNESLSFTTNGGAWQQVAAIANGAGMPTLTGLNTTTVKETGNTTNTVGAYVFRSDNNPTQISSTLVAGGLQGIIIGLRYASVSVVSQFNIGRYNAADQITYGIRTSGGTILDSDVTTGTANSGFTVAALPTVAASYPFTVYQAMAGGSVGTLSNYTTLLTCTNSNPSPPSQPTPLPTNQPVSSWNFSSLQYGDTVLCTFTNTPNLYTIAGTVYNDLDHDGAPDNGEAGPGTSGFYVKVASASGGSCSSPALQAVAVDPSTGAFTVTGLQQGTYCVILDSNNTLSDVAPGLPSGWLGTQNASGQLQASITGTTVLPPQWFGVYNGSRLAGSVFADTGTSSGIANNGIRESSESGLSGVTVTATSGATQVGSAVTAGDGSFTLWVPASVATAVTVTPATPTGYLATGGSAGTTGGTYTRPSLVYTPVAGQVSTGVGFGFATPNTLQPNGAETGQPGTVVFYAHTFSAGSGGQVTFSLSGAATPATPAWSSVLYQDSNCSGALDAGEPVVSAAMTVTVGQKVCLVVKQFVPAGSTIGAQNIATLTASFVYTNASPALTATLTVTDVTTVGEATALALKKLVSNVTRGGAVGTSVTASPGETLQYSLTAQNNGNSALSSLVINDGTPAFTTFVSAACPGTLPAGITGCSVTTQPTVGAQGSIQWTFTGTLASGVQLAVSYQVKLSQ